MIETDEVVTLRLPAHARYIRIARLVGAGLANELGIDLDGLDDVRLAIGEACSLATQFGAESIDMQFALDDARLTVTGSGHTAASAAGSAAPIDDSHVKLVRQILDVACAGHELRYADDGLSFSLTFAGQTDDGS